MLIEVFKGKIHRATVTEAHLDYEGSLAVDPELIAAAGMVVGEKVQVVNLNNGARFETYLIKGEPGQVCLNGPAARLGLAGTGPGRRSGHHHHLRAHVPRRGGHV